MEVQKGYCTEMCIRDRYKVSYRDNLFFSFSDEKEILAKSPENACVKIGRAHV